MEDVIYSSATQMAGAIKAKQISSVELVQAHLERINQVNPKINAVVQLVADKALEGAQLADDALARGEIKGPLHGIPMTIKDSFETAGVVTTAGTKGLRNYVPEQDATVVARLRAAGAILLGKTNTSELTIRGITDNFVYGRTNNPYDLERIPAGSSGGAGAIVAAGGSPFDIGTDTGGSIRLPAHFCGVAGLKPTFGRVPRTGHLLGIEAGAADALTQPGPLARYVEDLRLILPIISGVDWRDATVVPVPLKNPDEVVLKDLRVAFYTDHDMTPPSDETIEMVHSVASELGKAGAVVVEDRLPGVENIRQFWAEILYADGGEWLKNLLHKLGTTEMHPGVQWTQDVAVQSSASYFRLLEQWNTLCNQCTAFMENYDLVICPINATAATRHDEPTNFGYTYIYNLVGWPVVAVRCGTSPEGLPIGVQVAARPWREDVALAVAQHLETAFGSWRPPPF